MKKYNITVNGKTYQVEVEEVRGAQAEAVSQAAASPQTAPATAPAAVSEPAAGTAGASEAAAATAPKIQVGDGESAVSAPMPGTVLDVKVTEGQQVSSGDVVVILEAMKMENEITATMSGTVASVAVVKGAAVNAGDVLITVK